MHNAKVESGVKSSQLSFQLQVLPASLRRLEKGTHNFSMEKAIEYLKAFGYVITMVGKCGINLTTYDLFPLWVAKARGKMSQRVLAEKTGITYVTIANIESNKNYITVDYFLKIADTLGYEVHVTKL
jgi:DNA-binding XRE family transcriptional regulator